MVEQGANVIARNSEGVTALMYASGADFLSGMGSDGGYIGGVEILKRSGAEVNARDSQGYTALRFVEKAGFTRIVRVLKRAGARE